MFVNLYVYRPTHVLRNYYVCIYLHNYVCMCVVCISVSTHICIYIYMYICMYVYGLFKAHFKNFSISLCTWLFWHLNRCVLTNDENVVLGQKVRMLDLFGQPSRARRAVHLLLDQDWRVLEQLTTRLGIKRHKTLIGFLFLWIFLFCILTVGS